MAGVSVSRLGAEAAGSGSTAGSESAFDWEESPVELPPADDDPLDEEEPDVAGCVSAAGPSAEEPLPPPEVEPVAPEEEPELEVEPEVEPAEPEVEPVDPELEPEPEVEPDAEDPVEDSPDPEPPEPVDGAPADEPVLPELLEPPDEEDSFAAPSPDDEVPALSWLLVEALSSEAIDTFELDADTEDDVVSAEAAGRAENPVRPSAATAAAELTRRAGELRKWPRGWTGAAWRPLGVRGIC